MSEASAALPLTIGVATVAALGLRLVVPVVGELPAWTTLAEVEGAFPGAGLLRIQRHLLLRPEAVLGLRPLEGGRASVRVAEGLDLEVSRSATPRIKELLGL